MEELVKNQKIIETGIEALKTGASVSEKRVLDAMLKSLEQYPVVNGRFVWEKANMKLLAKLNSQLASALENADFDKSVLRYFDNFDEIGENIASLHKRVNKITVTNATLQEEKNLIIEGTLQGLLEARVNQVFMIPVKQGLLNKIRFGASVTETEAYLREVIAYAEETGGIIHNWVGQVARDAANQYEGTIHQKVKDEFKLTKWEYLGTVVEKTRPQCLRWLEMGTLNDSELQDEIDWAFDSGRGMIDGTDASTFGIYRGGYNCLHSAVPVK